MNKILEDFKNSIKLCETPMFSDKNSLPKKKLIITYNPETQYDVIVQFSEQQMIQIFLDKIKEHFLEKLDKIPTEIKQQIKVEQNTNKQNT